MVTIVHLAHTIIIISQYHKDQHTVIDLLLQLSCFNLVTHNILGCPKKCAIWKYKCTFHHMHGRILIRIPFSNTLYLDRLSLKFDDNCFIRLREIAIFAMGINLGQFLSFKLNIPGIQTVFMSLGYYLHAITTQ